MISRIIINNKTTQKADFLDLCLELNNPSTFCIEVLRKTPTSSISDNRNRRDRYIKNNQGKWFKTLSQGMEINQEVKVVKYQKQYIIQCI